ncbi:hypothetical protein [Kovacikia minuta]|nr:hypothetical protein [Kovacikia minuta]
MSESHPLIVDFTQEEQVLQILPRPPLRSSVITHDFAFGSSDRHESWFFQSKSTDNSISQVYGDNAQPLSQNSLTAAITARFQEILQQLMINLNSFLEIVK